MPSPSGVPIKLADGEWKVRYTNASLVNLEDLTEKTPQDLFKAASRGSLRAISMLLWAGLIHQRPNLSLSEVVKAVDLHELAGIADAIGKALAAAFGTEDEAEETPEPDEGKAEAAPAT